MSDKTLIELAKDSPLVTAAGLTLAGVSLSDWVLIMTALYAAFRLISGGIDLYDKIKEKLNARKQ